MIDLETLANRTMNYYLAEDGKTPIPAKDIEEWCQKFRDDMRMVKRHVQENGVWREAVRYDCGDGAWVSTVFLGIDHAFGDGPPVLWETMIFGGPHNDYQERYTSYEDALAGHERALKLAQELEVPESVSPEETSNEN